MDLKKIQTILIKHCIVLDEEKFLTGMTTRMTNACAREINEALIIPVVMPMLADINFREMRKAKGLTLKNVEEKTGFSNAYLSQLETGKVKSPGYLVVKKLYELYAN